MRWVFFKCLLLLGFACAVYSNPAFARIEDIRDPSLGCGSIFAQFVLEPDPHSHSNVVSKNTDGINPKIWRTDRSADRPDPVSRETLRDIYPKSWFQHLTGLNVLDIGCGDGGFVREMNSGKFGPDVQGWGLDLALDKAQEADLHFIRGAAHSMPIKSNSVDIAFATISFFHYTSREIPGGPETMRKSFSEIDRVFKQGGRLRMGYITEKDIPFIQSQLPNFEMTAKVSQGKTSFENEPYYAVELTKKR